MRVIPTSIPDVFIIEPTVHEDERGYFYESFNERRFAEATGVSAPRFVQDNNSKSVRNVLRGLHYQIKHTQGRLVRALCGEVFDVSVDLRKSSPTFGQWVGVTLSGENMRQLWIPEGFAHGYLVISESAEFLYKTTEYWVPEHERCILWNDPDIGIEWPLNTLPLLSKKDGLGQEFAKAEFFHEDFAGW